MLWHEQNWPTIQKLDKQIPVVLPLGSMEQHGHHLPLFVDTMQVTRIAQTVEKQMGDKVLMLPTEWLGCSEHHLDFPGTVSVPASLYSKMIKSMARCVLRAGFKRIFFLNGHGGNEVPGAQALTEYVGESDEADDAFLVFASWWHGRAEGDRAGEAWDDDAIHQSCVRIRNLNDAGDSARFGEGW